MKHSASSASGSALISERLDIARRLLPPLVSAEYRDICCSPLCAAACWVQAHGQAVLDSRQADLVEVVIASLDGEKDPRCLLLGLRCVRAAAELYGRQPEDSLHAQRFEVGRRAGGGWAGGGGQLGMCGRSRVAAELPPITSLPTVQMQDWCPCVHRPPLPPSAGGLRGAV